MGPPKLLSLALVTAPIVTVNLLFSLQIIFSKNILRISDKARYNLNAGCKKNPEVLGNRKSTKYKTYSVQLLPFHLDRSPISPKLSDLKLFHE